MRSIARRHPLAVFLAIAYGASAAIFALPLLSLAGIGVINLDLPGVAPFVLLDTFALAGAAFVTTALAEGRSGVRELRRRVFNFRVNPGWYVLAILLLPVTAMATAIVVGGTGVLAAIVGRPGDGPRDHRRRLGSLHSPSSTCGRRRPGPASPSSGSSPGWVRSAPAS